LRTYFEKYKYSNASTEDFVRICEEVSGKDLSKFFDEWVYTGEDMINLDYKWKVEKTGDEYKTVLDLTQTQKKYDTYQFQIDILLIEGEKNLLKTFYVNSKTQKIEIISEINTRQIVLDPYNWLLANTFDKNLTEHSE
jgi:aminopeptidase N